MRFYISSPAKPGCEALFLGSGWKGFHRQAEVPGTKVVSLCSAVGSTAAGSTVLALEGVECSAAYSGMAICLGFLNKPLFFIP